jgi:hypothetical protein
MHLELYLFWGDEGGLIDATRTWLDDAYAREIALTHIVHFANYGLKQLITSMVLLLFTTRVFITAPYYIYCLFPCTTSCTYPVDYMLN